MTFRRRPDDAGAPRPGRVHMKGAPERRRLQDGRGERIRCPQCGWEPKASDRWGCSCGHTWNTFETGGTCPSCGREWEETQCLRCRLWSRHRAWYAEGD